MAGRKKKVRASVMSTIFFFFLLSFIKKENSVCWKLIGPKWMGRKDGCKGGREFDILYLFAREILFLLGKSQGKIRKKIKGFLNSDFCGNNALSSN